MQRGLRILRFHVLGTGGAFSTKYFHSNFIAETDRATLLIDAGTTLRYSLATAGVAPDSIDYIVITHFHHDHVGGLVELLMMCYWRFIEGQHVPHRPTLLLRPGQVQEMETMLAPQLHHQGLHLADYCRILSLPSLHYTGADFTLELLPTDHLHCLGLQSFGLKLCSGPNNLIITSDIKKLEGSPFLAAIDPHTKAIIHDVQLTKSAVHAEVGEVLAHYPPHLHPLLHGIHYEDMADPAASPIRLLRQGEILTF